ncbi:MAG: DUF1579 domain-containing protein [Bacteroidota bacterium]
MRKIFLAIGIIASSLSLSQTAAAQTPDSAAMMKAWMDFATPSAMHKWIASLNGNWDADITSYGNPANPERSKGTAVYSSLLNGLYQEGKVTGNMMGMPFEGKSWMGYDNSKKEFVVTWIDNIGSGIILMKGKYDEATKTLTLKGSQTDPFTGKDSDIREIMKVIDNDNYSMEMYGTGPDGKEVKFMDAVYKRKGK